jgi:hypothetical protein
VVWTLREDPPVAGCGECGIRVLIAVLTAACTVFAAAVLVTSALRDGPDAAPPPTGTTTVPATAPATSEATARVSGGARGATGP